MSMASPTLRSSSSTLPWPSLSSCATDRLALPSAAEMLTGTSNTGARSTAVFSLSSPGMVRAMDSGNSSSGWSLSAALGFGSGSRGYGFAVQALGGQRRGEGFADASGGVVGVEGGLAVSPFDGEGGGGKSGRGAKHHLAREAGVAGNNHDHTQQPGVRVGHAHDQARLGLDLARQGLERRGDRRIREAVERAAGDDPGRLQRQLRRGGR